MIEQNIFDKIIDAAIHAPSGDNCQPWEFGITKDSIFLFNIPQRDDSMYSSGQKASMVALGAALENMIISAEHLGFQALPEYFPNKQNPNLVCILSLKKDLVKNQPLYETIFYRCTNRKFYKKTKVEAGILNEIKASGNIINGAKILFQETEENKKILGTIASSNEKLLFENSELHRFFFEHINWNLQEDYKKRIGFYIKTLELPPPVRLGFHLFRHWPAVKLLNKLGFSSMVAKTNANIYSSSGAIGLIAMDSNSAKDYLLAGRILQRVWLTTNKNGLAFQPLTGIFFLHQKILAEETENLSKEQIEFVEKNISKAKQIFSISNSTPIMMFRIGTADQPSAKTTRLTPIINKL